MGNEKQLALKAFKKNHIETYYSRNFLKSVRVTICREDNAPVRHHVLTVPRMDSILLNH